VFRAHQEGYRVLVHELICIAQKVKRDTKTGSEMLETVPSL
jgi:hypothetical protein